MGRSVTRKIRFTGTPVAAAKITEVSASTGTLRRQASVSTSLPWIAARSRASSASGINFGAIRPTAVRPKSAATQTPADNPTNPPIIPANTPALAARYMMTGIDGTGATESAASKTTAMAMSAPVRFCWASSNGSAKASPSTTNGTHTKASTNKTKRVTRTVWSEGAFIGDLSETRSWRRLTWAPAR